MDRMMTVMERRTKTELKKVAVELTSGRIPQSWIKLVHPFARRHGRPLAPLLPINIDTGRLRAGWRFRQRKKRSGTLYNVASYTRYILSRRGTQLMFARGFWNALRLRYDKLRTEKIRQKREAEK